MGALRRLCLRACALAAAAVLSACVSVPALPDQAAAQQVFEGRLALHAEATPARAAQAFTAQFALATFGEGAGTLRLTSPIGLQLAQAHWGPEGASLDTGRGPVAYGDLAELGQAVFGQPVPLAALEYWLAGRPVPDIPSELQPGGFVQTSWAITTTDLATRGLLLAQRRVPSTVSVRIQLDRAPGQPAQRAESAPQVPAVP